MNGVVKEKCVVVRSKGCCVLLKRCTCVQQFRAGKTRIEKERKQKPTVSSVCKIYDRDERTSKEQRIN